MKKLGASMLVCALLAPWAPPSASAHRITTFEKEMLLEERAHRAEEKAAHDEEHEEAHEEEVRKTHEAEQNRLRRIHARHSHLNDENLDVDGKSVDTADEDAN